VAFTFNKTKEAASFVDLTEMDKAEAVNDKTVVFHMKKPMSIFPYQVATLGIVPEHLYGDGKAYAQQPIGSGPYKFVQWDRGQQLIVERNDDYYGGKAPFKRIVFLFLNNDAAYAAAQAGKVDVVKTTEAINPFQFSAYSINALIGLLSAAIAACVAIVLRYLSTRHHTFEIIFYFMAAVTLVPIPMIWNNFVVPSYTELFYLIILGAIALVGQIFLTRAFSHDCVAVVEVVRYIGIIYNAVWGFLFWNEAPVLTTVIGGIFIIGSCIALSNPSSAKK
jgi:uncharacterized membrane protein